MKERLIFYKNSGRVAYATGFSIQEEKMDIEREVDLEELDEKERNLIRRDFGRLHIKLTDIKDSHVAEAKEAKLQIRDRFTNKLLAEKEKIKAYKSGALKPGRIPSVERKAKPADISDIKEFSND